MLFKDYDIEFAAYDVAWASELSSVDSLSPLFSDTYQEVGLKGTDSLLVLIEDMLVSALLFSDETLQPELDAVSSLANLLTRAEIISPKISEDISYISHVLTDDISPSLQHVRSIEAEVNTQDSLQPELQDNVYEVLLSLSKNIRPKMTPQDKTIYLEAQEDLDMVLTDNVFETSLYATGSLSPVLATDVYIEADVFAADSLAFNISDSISEVEISTEDVIQPGIENVQVAAYLTSSDSLVLEISASSNAFSIDSTVFMYYNGTDWVEKTSPVYVKGNSGWRQATLRVKQVDGSWM